MFTADLRARSALVKMYRPFLPVAPAIVYPVGPRKEHGKSTHRDPTYRSQCRARRTGGAKSAALTRQVAFQRVSAALVPANLVEPGSSVPSRMPIPAPFLQHAVSIAICLSPG